jgi:hypothetical protein
MDFGKSLGFKLLFEFRGKNPPSNIKRHEKSVDSSPTTRVIRKVGETIMSSEGKATFCPLIREECKKKECMLYVVDWDLCSINFIWQQIDDLNSALIALGEGMSSLMGQ